MKLAHSYLHPSVQICVIAELAQRILRLFEKSEGLSGATLVPWLTVLEVFLIDRRRRIIRDFHRLSQKPKDCTTILV